MKSASRAVSRLCSALPVLALGFIVAGMACMFGPAMSQENVRSAVRPWPDTSSTGSGAVMAWEVLESRDPRWWMDQEYRPRASSLILGQMLQIPLGAPWLEWRQRRESPTSGCVAFQGDTGVDYRFMDRDRYWIYRCAFLQAAGTLEFYAYLLGDSDQPAIERVRWVARPGTGLPAHALVEARSAILAGLTARSDLHRGSPREPQQWNDPLLVEGWEIFATPHGHVRLGFTRDDGGAADSDSLLVLDLWSSSLLADEAAAQSSHREESPGRRFGTMPLPEGTQAALDQRWPGLGRALRRTPRSLIDLPEIRRSVEIIRARELAGDSTDRALVLFATSHWAWAFDDTSDTTVVRRIEDSLGPVGLRGEWGHYDGTWHPLPSLLLEVIAGAGDDPWLDRAFLYMQETGWETNPFVDSLQQFRVVIDRGERFLRDHPRSTAWTDVARTVALAHETAWSLAKASPLDEYVDWTLYAPAASGHRSRAIRLYEEVLTRWGVRPPDPRVRNDVRHRLIRLRLDVDTGTRAYFPTSC